MYVNGGLQLLYCTVLYHNTQERKLCESAKFQDNYPSLLLLFFQYLMNPRIIYIYTVRDSYTSNGYQTHS